MNPRKGKILKEVWYSGIDEYRQLIEALNQGENDKVLDIIYKIHKRGDL